MPLTRPDDAERQVRLDRMKRLATGLLVLATVVFIVARYFERAHPWLGYIRATAEAAMVGGLADWFAVTALFRRPLGLPIPHTAIVAARKDRIGRTLGNFVQHNFLSRAVVARKLAGMRLAERALTWLADPEHARVLARQAATGLARSAEAIPDEHATRLIAETLTARVRSTRVAPIIGNVLSLMTADSRHQELLDDALELAKQAVDENRDLIRLKVMEESPWWVPGVIDDRIYQKILSSIEHLLHEVHDDPHHPLRTRFDQTLYRFINNLQHSPEMIARTEALKDELLGQQMIDELSTSIWRGARDGLVRYAAQLDGTTPALASGESAEASEAPAAAPVADAHGAPSDGANSTTGDPTALERGIISFAESVLANEAMLAEVDNLLTDAVLGMVEQHRHEVGELISNTVSSWDPVATSHRIELAIGRDLQFIRINGTIVGGLAGLVIYLVSKLF
jgi:uncharacterized membrane-anchored protein YjiN (DUF445 family)